MGVMPMHFQVFDVARCSIKVKNVAHSLSLFENP